MEGRVEVLYNGIWGTVCDDGWGLNDATVVCRMLGYEIALGAPGRAHFGEGSGEILLDDVSCLGTENNLATCRSRGFLRHNCGHQEDAGVVCEHIIRSGILCCCFGERHACYSVSQSLTPNTGPIIRLITTKGGGVRARRS